MSTSETILDPEIADIDIRTLNLNQQISHRLSELDFVTLGDIYGLQAEGISLAIQIEYAAAQAYWLQALEVISNPDEWQRTQSVDYIYDDHKISLTDVLPTWLKELFSSNSRERDYTVLHRRYGLDGKAPATLEEISIYLDITREGVRQIQKRALELIRRNLFVQGDIFNRGVNAEIVRLKQVLEQDGAPARSESELFQQVTSRYGVALTRSLKQHYILVYELFGWTRITDRSSHTFNPEPFWILDQSRVSSTRILEAGRRIAGILQEACIRLEYFEIKVALNSKRQTRYTDLEIRTAIKAFPDIEAFEDDTFELVFNRLRSAADQAYRVLSEHGEPLPATDIYREIARRLALTGEKVLSRYTISNSMVNDPRFKAIGKSRWALESWEDVTLGTIVEHMKQYFHQNNKPAKASEVYEFVRKRRSVNKNSITTYLTDRDEFVRVGRGLYQLAEWGRADYTPPGDENSSHWSQEELAKIVVSIFEAANSESMIASELVQRIISLGMSSNNIYSRLRQCPAVKLSVVTERPRRLNATVVKDYTFEKPVTLRDRLEEAVREILLGQPDNSMLLVELRNSVTKRINVRPPTFYGYLSDMIDVQKNVVAGAVVVTLSSKGSTGDSGSVPDKWDREFVYDVAISYAGAQRAHASDLAQELRERNLRIFFDRNQLPDLVGRNLLDELLLIYRDKAMLCVILASEQYNLSPYAQHERQSAQDRALRDDGYIVLVNLDGCAIRGFHSTVVYLDWNQFGLKYIATHVYEQYKRRQK